MTKESYGAINFYNQGVTTWYCDNPNKAEVEPFEVFL